MTAIEGWPDIPMVTNADRPITKPTPAQIEAQELDERVMDLIRNSLRSRCDNEIELASVAVDIIRHINENGYAITVAAEVQDAVWVTTDESVINSTIERCAQKLQELCDEDHGNNVLWAKAIAAIRALKDKP